MTKRKADTHAREEKPTLQSTASHVPTRAEFEGLAPDVRIALIQELVPLALMAAREEMEREVEELAGTRYGRKNGDGGVYRFGFNPGSVKLGSKRYPIRVPRIRTADGEISLKSYELLHNGAGVSRDAVNRMLRGVSCRSAVEPAEGETPPWPAPSAGSRATLSREFIAASTQELQRFRRRDLSTLDLVAVFMDGKYFGDQMMILAMGITLEGKKVFLGFEEAGTENARVVAQFLRSLQERGLQTAKGVLAIVDGSKGLVSAIKTVFKREAVVQRCQWHKRENVVAYMSKGDQARLRKRLQAAYERPTYKEATEALQKIQDELKGSNQSAYASLQEGIEETLTLHRLGVFSQVGRSFKTTNCIESAHSMVEDLCSKVDFWTNSMQRQRWLAAAALNIEPRLRRVQGHKSLPTLRQALMKELNLGR